MSELIDTGRDKKAERNERIMHAQTGCDTCKFCGVMNAMDKTLQLICRRNVPVVSAACIPTQAGPQWISATSWPAVQKGDWCGSYEPKLQS